MIFITLRLMLWLKLQKIANDYTSYTTYNLKNNEQQGYKILALLRPQKRYSTALSEKKKETVILHDKLCRQHRATQGGNEMTRKVLMKQ